MHVQKSSPIKAGRHMIWLNGLQTTAITYVFCRRRYIPQDQWNLPLLACLNAFIGLQQS